MTTSDRVLNTSNFLYILSLYTLLDTTIYYTNTYQKSECLCWKDVTLSSSIIVSSDDHFYGNYVDWRLSVEW